MMGLLADVEERRGKVEEEFSLFFSFGLFFRASWLSTTKAYLSFCRMTGVRCLPASPGLAVSLRG